MMTQKVYPVAAVLLCTAALGNANPQTPGAIGQMDTAQQQQREKEALKEAYRKGQPAPELYPGESTDVGPQYILQIVPRKTHFEVMFDSQYYWSSNVRLEETSEQDATVMVSTAQFALAPEAYDLWGGEFSPRAGYRHQWYNFGFDDSSLNLDQFDFNVQTLFVDGRYRFGENWIAEGGLAANRLLSSHDYDEFYSELMPRWGLHRQFPVRDTTVFTVGYVGYYHFTEADVATPGDAFDRLDYVLQASCTQTLARNLFAQPYYRYRYSHFTGGVSRDDWDHTVGLSLAYFFNNRLSARAFVAYEIKDSNNAAIPDYERLDAGGGLNLIFRF